MEDQEYSRLINLQPVVNVGVLGHVAHGKSTVVKQITGIKTQKFANEQKSGRTVKLGYANVKIFKCDKCSTFYTRGSNVMNPPACEVCTPPPEVVVQNYVLGNTILTTKIVDYNDKTTVYTRLVNHISFVDAPGHESLMTTMLNGTAVMDCAMLVIASNEKVPQLQTQEHLVAAEVMGLNNVLLIQNKIDLISKENAVANAQSILGWVKGTCAENSPLIPISAQFGYGIQRVIEALANLRPANRGAGLTPVFACIRSFDVNKPGLVPWDLSGGVIGGTLLQGKLAVGDQVTIKPGVKCANEAGEVQYVPFVTNVTAIRSEENELDAVIPGGLIAIGTTLDPYFTSKDYMVGCILGRELPELTHEIAIKYKILKDSPIKAFKVGDSIRVTALSRTILGTITDVVSASKKIVKLTLTEPICLLPEYAKFSLSMQINRQWRLIGLALLQNDNGKRLINELPPDFGRGLPDYDTLYTEIANKYKFKASEKVSQLKVDPPKCASRGGARTAWENFGTIAQQLNRPITHFQNYVGNELASNTSVTEKNELILYGKYKPEQMESILRNYLKEYCKCSNCGNCVTSLQQEANTDIIVCSYCGRNQMISSAKQAIPKKGKGGKIKII